MQRMFHNEVTMEQNEYISVAEFAKEIGLSRTQVFRYVKNGTIQAKRFGHAYLIPADELRKVTGEISDTDRLLIDKAVKKTLKDYGSVIKDLGDQ